MIDLKRILEYQKNDSEVVKLERQLNGNENKKIYSQMVSVVKEAQNQSSALENEAGNLASSYERLKKTYNDNLKSVNAITNKNINNMGIDELKSIEDVAKTIVNNLTILEKKLLNDAERVRNVLQGFEATKKKYNVAREKYNKHKALFDEESKSLKAEIDKKNTALKELESGIEQNILNKYKQKRQDGIYPVFVPCMDKACGGCRMELPSASLSTLKKDGIFECEHCHRIIYIV
ncbi:MAG: hypothetical protein J6T74_10175 [Clostridia bacterium]|nr:hypothetical protein [Clostridia bacterium]